MTFSARVIQSWLSHPIRHFLNAAKELARKERALKHLSLNAL